MPSFRDYHVCERDHGLLVNKLKRLPSSQKVVVRHICAGCAYAQGFKDGITWVKANLKNLPDDGDLNE